jgi:zinc/manganese transport system substrate-binding protein
MKKKSLLASLAILGLSLGLSGCSSTDTADNRPTIVATTSVWADVASQIAGDKFNVIALIDKPSQDPHSYEASARDQLAVSESSLFIMNGGGYDEFATKLASAAEVVPFDVYETHEKAHGTEHKDEHAGEHKDEHAGEHTDEHAHGHDGSDHIWYDLHVVEATALDLSKQMAVLQPDNKNLFDENYKKFAAQIEALEIKAEKLTGKLSYFEAHPLAALLFKELGFNNLTPEGFAEAEEAGLEPSPLIMKSAKDLIGNSEVDFVAVNPQATSTSLEQLINLAQENSVPVLNFDELLPEGTNYQEWMLSILDEIESLTL